MLVGRFEFKRSWPRHRPLESPKISVSGFRESNLMLPYSSYLLPAAPSGFEEVESTAGLLPIV
jgi:hypothetical protein